MIAEQEPTIRELADRGRAEEAALENELGVAELAAQRAAEKYRESRTAKLKVDADVAMDVAGDARANLDAARSRLESVFKEERKAAAAAELAELEAASAKGIDTSSLDDHLDGFHRGLGDRLAEIERQIAEHNKRGARISQLRPMFGLPAGVARVTLSSIVERINTRLTPRNAGYEIQGVAIQHAGQRVNVTTRVVVKEQS